jgi:hypothetical protein
MLLMVLLFVMVVGLALAALLPYTRAGLREAATARDVRSGQNAVDGAVQGAIANVRRDLEQGNERSGRCDTYNAASYLTPVVSSAIDVQVTCQNALGGGGAGSVDLPPYAIVATTGDMTVSGGHALAVQGGLYVRGAINTTGSSGSKVVVTGDAISGTGVCGNVVATGLQCPTTSIPAMPPVSFPSALGADAAAAAAAIAALPKDPQGTCTSKFSIVTFTPGYYSEPPTVGPSCTSVSNTQDIWWFSPCTPYPTCVNLSSPPGVYLFDFPDGSYGSNYSNAGNSTTGPGSLLDLGNSNLNVIGGSLVNGYDSSTNASVLDTATPGKRCDPASLGVQIVLGGPARIRTGNGSSLELCASPTSATSKQRIAIYGLSNTYGLLSPAGPRTPTDNGPDGVPANDPATTPTSPSTDLPFRNASNTADNPDGARTANDGLNVAVGTFTGGPKTYGSVLTNFPAVPAGSLIAQAYLDVTHLESDSHITPKITVTYSSGVTDTCTVPSTPVALPPTLTQSAFTVDRIDLMTGCSSNYLAKAPLRWKELTTDSTDPTKRFSVRVEEAGSNPAVGKGIIDGVQLQTSAVPPALEAERCMSGSSSPCTVEAYSNSGSSATDNTYFVGTLYTPSAALNAVVHNSPNTIFQRGVVVASAIIVANASSKQTDPPFQLPHSAVRNRSVLFIASSGGRVRLRALVHFIDCMPAPACETTPNAVGNLVWPGKVSQVQAWTPLQ